MRSGKSLQELATELTRINDSKKDFIVPAAKLEMTKDAKLSFTNGSSHEFGVTNWANNQLSQYLNIPRAYYDRLRTNNPSLLSENVNWGLSTLPEDRRMIRTLDGNVRAVLSSRYRRLDSYDLVQSVLPSMIDAKMDVVSTDITEKRLYVRALLPALKKDVTPGDTVQYGLQISSSDVGAGSLRVEPLLFRLVCSNGMITSHAMKKYHIGRNMAEGDDVMELLSERTIQMTDEAFWSQVQDVVAASMRPEIFDAQVAKLQDAASQRITNFDLEQVVELTMKSVGYNPKEGVRQGIVEALASGNQGAGLTKYGLANSFTWVAERDVSLTFDDCVDLERVGGQIIELGKSQWAAIAEKR